MRDSLDGVRDRSLDAHDKVLDACFDDNAVHLGELLAGYRLASFGSKWYHVQVSCN